MPWVGVGHTWFLASPLQWGCRALGRSPGEDKGGAGSSVGQGRPCGEDRRSHFHDMPYHLQDKVAFLVDTKGYPHGRREHHYGSLNHLLGRLDPLQGNPTRCQGRGREVVVDVVASTWEGT